MKSPVIAAATRAEHVRADDHPVGADAGELRDLLVAADGIEAVAEAAVAQQEPGTRRRPRAAGHRDRDRAPALEAERLWKPSGTPVTGPA